MRNSTPYKVECKSSYPFFETIAAFNLESAAQRYAKECADAVGPLFEYRVTYRGKVLETASA